MTIEAHATTTGLHLLVDSTGIKMLGEGEWKTKKHEADCRRQWRKVDLGIDASTLEIRPIEVTDNATGDAPMLACLLDQISLDEAIASVSGDGAYDTKGCNEAIAQRGAKPSYRRARMPNYGKTSVLVPKHATLFFTPGVGSAERYGRSGLAYHRRSLVETKMRCFELLGEGVMARDFDRQVAELQVRAAILNRFTRLGPTMTVATQ